jgi:hypothetical protein
MQTSASEMAIGFTPSNYNSALMKRFMRNELAPENVSHSELL